ncbi:MAG: E3 ubiquitin ligase family protein [Oligoflexia bacterium]|nr:E3 ubiquitin ligase family protein [Oligoflexia bacterium]
MNPSKRSLVFQAALGVALLLTSNAAWAAGRNDDPRGVAVALFAFGIFAFFYGFKILRHKRLIENTPTSRIRSMPQGPVELCGKALRTTPLFTPFSAVPCAYFEYKVEEYRSSGKKSRWVTIRSGNSKDQEFAIEDETGRVRILPQGAEVMIPRDQVFQNGLGSSLPPNAQAFLEGHGLSTTGLLGFGRRLRLTEAFIAEGDPLYVFGTAMPINSAKPREQKQKVMERLRRLKQDPAAMARLDTNHDGVVSADEWERARQAVERDAAEGLAPEQRTIIVRGTAPFIISDKSEKGLLDSLRWKIIGGIYGGPALMAIAAAIFLHHNRT